MVVLRRCGYKALIYVYRKRKLAADLRDPQTADFLKGLGYDPEYTDGCVRLLKERIYNSPGFPHEIGLFLGYPLHDVIGFIQNNGKNFSCCGFWKVYYDRHAAQKCFERYKKCRSVYLSMFQKGKSIMQLTVTASRRRDEALNMEKLAVVYWSGTGNTKIMACYVAEGAMQAGAEVSVMQPGRFFKKNGGMFFKNCFWMSRHGDRATGREGICSHV